MDQPSQIVLITGVSSGIGFEIAKSLVNKGHTVLGSIRNENDQESIKSKLGVNFHPILLDVAKPESIINAVSVIKSVSSHIDVLINNAGIAVPGPLEELSLNAFTKQMDINVTGVFNMTNAILPFLKNSLVVKPRIINISSVSGMITTPFIGAYCVSKHALECLSDTYRMELMPWNIDVISIRPGPIKSKIWNKSKGQLEEFYEGAYGDTLKMADEFIEKTEKSALPASAVSELVLAIMNGKKKRATYIVHKYGFFLRMFTLLLTKRMMARMSHNRIKKQSLKRLY